MHFVLNQQKLQLLIFARRFELIHSLVIPGILESHTRTRQAGGQSEDIVPFPEKSVVDFLAHPVQQGDVRIQVLPVRWACIDFTPAE